MSVLCPVGVVTLPERYRSLKAQTDNDTTDFQDVRLRKCRLDPDWV
jgi:hypothetical protein